MKYDGKNIKRVTERHNKTAEIAAKLFVYCEAEMSPEQCWQKAESMVDHIAQQRQKLFEEIQTKDAELDKADL